MLQLLVNIFGILITILLVVGIHEFGHFIIAKLMGVKVLRFSIGFGRALWRRQSKSGTEYVLSAIPLGGYIKMLDEQEGTVAPNDLPFAYNRQPFYKKLAIVLAGPLFNLIFALLIYWILFMVGFTTVIPLIGKITPDSIAEKSGLQPQQQIISVDNQLTTNWIGVVINLLIHAGNKDSIIITTKSLANQTTQTYALDTAQWKLNDLKPDPLASLGILPYEPEIPAVIGKIIPNSPAATTLNVGDKIIALNKQPIKDWGDLIEKIDQSPDMTLDFTLKRNGKVITQAIKTTYVRDWFFQKHGTLGVIAEFHWPDNLLLRNQYNPWVALNHAWQDTVNFSRLNFIVFGKLFTGKMSFKSLGGPITIFESAGSALNHGIIPFLSFLAFLSISIGLINVLPVPGLDGGHVVMQLIEVIIRRPIPIRYQNLFYRLGFILILMLITQAVINDILRL